MHILVVEDEPKMLRLLGEGLRDAGYVVDLASDGIEALDHGATYQYDAMVLDLMIPGMDGMQVLRYLREREVWTPVLLLSALDAVEDKVRGLDGGADDYLVKPFTFAELLGRIRALIRRGKVARPVQLRCGALVLDPATREVTVHGNPVYLSSREFAVLQLLLHHDEAVVSRGEIEERVWGYRVDGVSNLVEVYIKHLRDKIDRPFGTNLIHTVRGAGYRIADVRPPEALRRAEHLTSARSGP